jgi:CRISPR-associated protein Csy2
MTGYKAISELYQAGDVENTRDNKTPARFVEAVHSVGEWKGAHKIKNITDIIWRYQHDAQWYLCRQKSNKGLAAKSKNTLETKTQTLNLADALNQF